MTISKFNAEGYYDPTPYQALKKKYMPLIYIASPFSGDIETNVERAKRYCRFAISKDYIPLAPHLHYPRFLDDGDVEERELGLHIALILLGKCEEVWVFGEISQGMVDEIAKAERRKMPIKYFNTKCEEVPK
jgi:hypothetical protein